MFIDKYSDGRITKIESRDVNFLKNKFLRKDEIVNNQELYELCDPNLDKHMRQEFTESEIPQSLDPNRSCPKHFSETSQDSQL